MNEARRDKRFRNRTSCRRRLQVGQGAELRCRAAPIPAAAAGNRSRGTRRGRRIRSTERGADHAFVGGLKRAGRRCCVRPWARGAREGGRCACRLRRRLQCASRQGARVEAGRAQYSCRDRVLFPITAGLGSGLPNRLHRLPVGTG